MECDSESSCEGRVKDLEASGELARVRKIHRVDRPSQTSDSILWHSAEDASTRPKVALNIANRSLSSQVMEYYQRYSQNSNLDQYFSLPTSNASAEGVQYYYSIYELNSKSDASRQGCIGQDYNLKTYIPRERRRWVRPPLIGQSSGADGSTMYTEPLMHPRSPSPDLKRVTPETIPEEKNESQEGISDVSERKVTSPTSSVASFKPLEWDSGADVGYFNNLSHGRRNDKKLSTIERMALARGCSVALRLDPEGTTESGASNKTLIIQTGSKLLQTPIANSTPLLPNVSESEGEIEITPIVKNHLSGIITGDDIKSEERNVDSKDIKQESNLDTPKSSSAFRMPVTKYATEGKKSNGRQISSNENLDSRLVPLKKCSSMNILAPTSIKLSLKRSQSEVNLHVKDKNKVLLPLIFNSTSSLATIINKPITCDKLIQTSINTYTRESVGVQVTVFEEEKPPLPKRGTSLTQKSIHSILKNPRNTYTKVQDSHRNSEDRRSCNRSSRDGRSKENASHRSSSEMSQNESASVTPQPDDTENVTGRANSFEYFPGHIYENAPNGSTSYVSSVDTGKSNSTMPNTSSSIDEKLWGDSDSLVRDLERSVNILKSLVDANKCDKQVKKRLIHHVVKRLVTAKYTDDKIEHNLEENIPWNPDDARKKIYKAEIIQALAKNSTDSSDEWKPQRKKKNTSMKKLMENDARAAKGIITSNLESSNSDKFDGHTDRTEMDGRKARMGLRTDDCHHSSNTPTDLNKSESSECFLPQRSNKSNELQNLFRFNKQCDLPSEGTTSNTIPSDRNRILLEAVVNNRQSSVDSSNGSGLSADWKLPTTLSERQFELRRCSNSDSGDTKLVSYAELEKRNQLIWITNEINHLSNLKRLLEQPRKLERSRCSPRKPKHAISKRKPMTALTCICGQKEDHDSLQRNTSDLHRSSMNEQWSSHCNLATYPATSTSNKSVRHLRKRNSCTQTATDTTSADSKTGGEIVSASIHQNPAIKSTNIYVQTLPEQCSPSPMSMHSQTAHRGTCSVHRTYQKSDSIDRSCKCRKHVSQDRQKMYTYHSQTQDYPQILSSNVCDHVASTSYPKEGRPVLSQSVAPTSADKIGMDILKSTCHHADMDNNNLKQKEAKNKLNKLNATKTKCTCNNEAAHVCRCVGECRCEMKGVEENVIRSKNLPEKMCELCSGRITEIDTDIVACSCDRCKTSNVRRASCDCPSDCTCENKQKDNAKRCDCPTVCNCENKQADRAQGKRSSKSCLDCFYNVNGHVYNHDSHGKSNKLCGCPNDCMCENKGAEEVQSTKKTCECHADCKCENRNVNQSDCCYSRSKVCNGPVQTRYVANLQESQVSQSPRVQNNPKCSCDTECSCVNKIKSIEEKSQESKHNAKSNHSSETNSNDNDRSCKCCRSCGITYQNGRKCGCHLHYPKPIAYELSFIKEDEQKNGDVSYPKQEVVEIKTLTKVSSNVVPNTAKFGGCSCDEVKLHQSIKSTNQRNTLQDYLATNKPEFVNNIETRRQYMFEISHLRELRKEKRVQLLAMASSSNTNKTSRSYKPPVRVQRKISDEEMKERLRKRYLRLNEVRTKRRQREKQEEARRNKLMASIFCKKLQQKVLKGQVDLSHSVSVISNL